MPVGEGVFGELVSAHRRRLGLTQEELAERAGLSVRTIRALESDRGRVPRAASVRLLADSLGIQGADREAFHQCAAATAGRSGAPLAVPAESGTVTGSPPMPVVSLTPAQLPPVLAGFIGRDDELGRLDYAVARPTVDAGARIWIVSGTAGVGKTTLALHWAHQVVPHFPDGQIYANLRGYDPSRAPREPAAVLHEFLRALGIAHHDIPPEFDARVGLYRSVVYRRRILIVLDNAADADQVRPLLPGTSSCMVMITSRDRMAALVAYEGAQWMQLGLLSLSEARQVCARRMGADTVRDEPAAVDRIIEFCARLPLALAIVTARAVTMPNVPLSDIADALDDAGGRLDSLVGDGSGTDVRTAFSWSYDSVSPFAARLFRLLALHPGLTITEAAAASLSGTPIERTRLGLSELVAAHLIAAEPHARFSLHDLLRRYGMELAGEHDPVCERQAAWRRLFSHYLHSAHGAAVLLRPDRAPITVPAPLPGVTVSAPSDEQQARDWFAAENLAVMDIIDRGDDADTWRLAWTLADYFHWNGRSDDWANTHRRALKVATVHDDPLGMAYCHGGIAIACTIQNDLAAAQHHYEQALEAYRSLDDDIGTARTHFNLANVFERLGRYRDALTHARHALDLRQGQALDGPLANAYNAVGWYHALLGEYDAALVYCRKALDVHESRQDHHGHAATLDSLGYIHHHLGSYDEAAARYRQAAEMFGMLGDQRYQATVLTRLADTNDAAGRAAEAIEARRRALEILTRLDHPPQRSVPGSRPGTKTTLLDAGTVAPR